jgi:hypothetical protein
MDNEKTSPLPSRSSFLLPNRMKKEAVSDTKLYDNNCLLIYSVMSFFL